MHGRLLLLFAIASLSARAEAQPKPGQKPAKTEPALYDLDTAQVAAPPANSVLDRMLKSLHVRACVRADVAPFSDFSANGLQATTGTSSPASSS